MYFFKTRNWLNSVSCSNLQNYEHSFIIMYQYDNVICNLILGRLSNIQVCCFAALATPKYCPPEFSLKDNKLIQELSRKYKKSWSQICLRYLTQQNLVTISAADDENQMKENIDSNSFNLDENDMKELEKCDKNKRIYIFDYAPG